jgi:3-oxoacyl-[acyl-carrier-protein] synthase-3
MKMYNAYIRGTGSYAPANVVKNDFFDSVGSSDEWIFKNLGIRERRISTGQTTSDLAALAGQQAIENAGLTPLDIDLIVVATATPDRPCPSCASFVQEKLEATNAVAFDIAAVCSGALFSIATAVQFVRSGMYKNVLVIGADTFSTIIDWSRRDAVFFGDGAGAMVLSQTTQNKGFLDFSLHTDGRGKEHFTVPAGGSEYPASVQTVDERRHFFQMNGKEVFKTAVEVIPACITELLTKNDVAIEDIKCMLPHQPSIRILQEVARKIGMPFEKVKTNMDRYANTSGGTIPIVLDEVHRNGGFTEGDLLLFAAVGAGWTWGAGLYRW